MEEVQKAAENVKGADILDALIRQFSQKTNGLMDISLHEFLGEMITRIAERERRHFLENNDQDKSNGFYPRNLALGSIPLKLHVPRVRSGDFRPAILPEKHQRVFADEHRLILFNLLAASRSKSAAQEALSRLNLPYSEKQVDEIVFQILEDFKLKNTAPLDPDLLALFMDGKHIEVREGHVLKPYVIYLIIGLTMQGRKQVLACLVEEGRESLEGWKKVLRNLIERGLRRVPILIQDDFSGLSKLNASLFPQSQIQLCIVHMMRNVTHHLSKEDAREVNGRLKSIFHAYDLDKASADFESLCQAWQEKYPTFMECLLKKKEMYLHFMRYPKVLRGMLSTTNTVEGINRLFEKIRLNNSGYFQSMDDLKMKLGLTIHSLEEGKWKNPYAKMTSVLHEMHLLFNKHFELDV